jgi:phosphate uptake regulator
MASYARRLQKIGSSMLVSLPINWIRQNRLNKGDTLLMELSNDNSIAIFPAKDNNEIVRDFGIDYPTRVVDILINQLFGAYLLGYDNIRIRARTPIDYEDREKILSATGKLVGLEIVDEDSVNINFQFLIDASSLDAAKILRRMNAIIKGMMRDGLKAIVNKDTKLIKLIVRRDDEIDRQYFLLVRLIRSAMLNQRIARKLNLSNIDILDYRVAANHLESAGDYVAEFSSSIPKLWGTGFKDEIVEAGMIVDNMQHRSISAFIAKDNLQSEDVVKMYSKFSDLANTIKEKSTKGSRSDPNISILNCVYSIDRIARCWVDIADLVKPVYRKSQFS